MPFSDFMPGAEQTFVLEVPPGTPADAEFYLQTNLSDYAPALPNYRFVDGVLKADFPIGALLSYKVTRGSAQSEEGDEWGERRPDRRTVVYGPATHHVRVQCWQDLHSGAGRRSTLPPGIETLSIYSPEVQDDFTVLIWTPPSYDQSSERCPVLYLHDGQNVFDRATSFAGEVWAADVAAGALAEEGWPCLLVAVGVRQKHRANDYVPFPMAANTFTSSAPAYQTFLTQTLKPAIDAHYRTRPEPRYTAQAGSSFGGVASLYGTLTRPDVWGTCGAFSPSLWVQDGALLNFARQHPAPELRLYVDMGTHEGLFVEDAAAAVRQTQWFAARSAEFVKEIKLDIGLDHWHDEPAWAERLPAFLRWWLSGLER